MYPEIVLGFLILSSYSIVYALAFLVSSSIFWLELKRRREKFQIFLLFSLALLLSGLAGARIYFLLLEGKLGDLLEAPIRTLSSPGTIYHGGFIFSLFIAFLLTKLTKRNFWTMADSLTPGLALAISIGRIGCFLNGCCLGRPTSLSWGVKFPGFEALSNLRLHPTQLYESLVMFLVFVFLWRIRKRNRPAGFLFSVYLLLWGSERFFLEFLRETKASPLLFLSTAQIASLIIFLFAIAILILKKGRTHSRGL